MKHSSMHCTLLQDVTLQAAPFEHKTVNEIHNIPRHHKRLAFENKRVCSKW